MAHRLQHPVAVTQPDLAILHDELQDCPALREIGHEPVRFGLITSVIALVAYLTFFLASLAVGLAHLYRAGIDGWNSASIAITDASNENLSASRLTDEQLRTAKDLATENGTTASTLMSTAAVAPPSGKLPSAVRSGKSRMRNESSTPSATSAKMKPISSAPMKENSDMAALPRQRRGAGQ